MLDSGFVDLVCIKSSRHNGRLGGGIGFLVGRETSTKDHVTLSLTS